MHIPGLMERVRVTGLDEVYLVTSVDYRAEVADLLPIVYGKRAVQAVPFVVMESIPGCDPPRLRTDDYYH